MKYYLHFSSVASTRYELITEFTPTMAPLPCYSTSLLYVSLFKNQLYGSSTHLSTTAQLYRT